jgi:haloalkane dehalogenase
VCARLLPATCRRARQVSPYSGERIFSLCVNWQVPYAGRLHYLDKGQGPPIVSCHGNPTWSFLYRTIVTRLRGQFRCVAVDHLGFGLSDRPGAFGNTVEEHARCAGDLVDHLQLDGFLTMGQDWGGPVSMTAGTARAERIRGGILGNTWFWPADQLAIKLFSRAARPLLQRLARDVPATLGSKPALLVRG